MNKEDLIAKLFAKKAEDNNTIDLDAYESGLRDMYAALNIADVMPSFLVTYKEEDIKKQLYWQINTIDKAEAESLFWKCHDVLCTIIDIKSN